MARFPTKIKHIDIGDDFDVYEEPKPNAFNVRSKDYLTNK